jgi:hypothetical protein
VKQWLDAGQSGHGVSVLYRTEGKVQSQTHNSSETGGTGNEVLSFEFCVIRKP